MKIIFILMTLFFSMQVSAAPLNKIVVFGDSLSDNGNLYEYMKQELPMSPPYFKGRFTNGPVWVELLTDMYYPQKHSQAHLLDYAFGGAGISANVEDDEVLFTLRREVDSYFLSHDDKADDSSLYVIWIGANNYLSVPEDQDAEVNLVISNIQHEVDRLLKKGAKHFLIVSVPDLGKTPIAKDFDAVDVLTSVCKKHNDTLKQVVADMKRDNPSVQWFYFDVNEIFNDMTNFPSEYGITNTVDTCYEEMVNKPSEKSIIKMVSSVKAHKNIDACTGYMFFDPVHPSEPSHIVMAERIKAMLDKAGVQFVE